jgi:hypothetical protein
MSFHAFELVGFCYPPFGVISLINEATTFLVRDRVLYPERHARSFTNCLGFITNTRTLLSLPLFFIRCPTCSWVFSFFSPLGLSIPLLAGNRPFGSSSFFWVCPRFCFRLRTFTMFTPFRRTRTLILSCMTAAVPLGCLVCPQITNAVSFLRYNRSIVAKQSMFTLGKGQHAIPSLSLSLPLCATPP